MMVTKKRFWELDALRGLAVIFMVIFHAAYDANFLGVADVEVWEGGWLVLARMTQVLFIGMAGVTMAFSSVPRRLYHSAVLLGWGMVITLITWVLFKEQAVKFGVLHFYAVAGVLALPLVRLRAWNGLLGAGVLAASFWVKDFTVTLPWLFPLGLTPPGFQSLDYFPLLPWFGLFLVGMAASSVLYGPERWSWHGAWLKDRPWSGMKFFETAGRYSLWIYLLHQPILIGILSFF